MNVVLTSEVERNTFDWIMEVFLGINGARFWAVYSFWIKAI
jgi:hypothetical protein